MRSRIGMAMASAVLVVFLYAGVANASRDGYITFDTASGINVINPDGSGHRLLIARSGARAADWSPNGKRLVFEMRFGSDQRVNGRTVVVVANAGGGGQTAIARGNSPQWLNNRYIAYFPSARSDSEHRGPVAAIDVRTKRKKLLTRRGSPFLSDNRRWMAYRHPDGRVVVSSLDGRIRRAFKLTGGYWAERIRWLGNVRFMHTCMEPREGRAPSDLCLVDIRNGRTTRMRGKPGLMESSAALSPSKSMIAWGAVDGLYVTNAAANNYRMIYPNPSWSGSNHPGGVTWRPR